MGDEVTIRLSMNEALVFFDWLAAANERDELSNIPAERRVLWDIEAQLEPKIPMIFHRDYADQVDKARSAIKNLPE